MIKKLRKKFIITNMSLVSVVLIVVFSVLCISSYKRINRENYNALKMAAEMPENNFNKKMELGGGRHPDEPKSNTPVLCVLLDYDGKVKSTSGNNAEMSEDVLEKAVKQVLASDKESGTISSLGVIYFKVQTPQGLKIAFADSRTGWDAMENLILTSLLVVAGALTAFFFISMFLSVWALRPVEQAWNQQRQFVADASHELKTPLTVILANTDILLSHRQSTIEEQVKWVEYIKEESSRMKKLVDDMLFLAKCDDSRIKTVKTDFNISDMIQSCVLSFEPVAFEHNVALGSSIKPDISYCGDEGQLRQIADILLDNACKYAGKKGRVNLRLKNGPDGVVLSVNNTGTPIPQESLDHLFERFYRVDTSRSRQQGGHGLGLSIAKSIADNHHAKISVKSTEQDGTTFTVILPHK